jgi:hypothetical protein
MGRPRAPPCLAVVFRRTRVRFDAHRCIGATFGKDAQRLSLGDLAVCDRAN